ncbi:dihydroorotate dehydrogenase PyrD [Sulfuracidifex metallicus]|uniref:dihydroorotate dehydrogenase PyrD n=1 Tax=Sulfuracidifex metallicus TaxID=47303 RepID=UPI0022747C58|nr:dihydroorotate dehydrogenase PyrD [Sulfuracidifex metallicus]MCY0849929.1 dihydroorotate dehydrogenase PyrD [Sulfuracidifex metallicus]
MIRIANVEMNDFITVASGIVPDVLDYVDRVCEVVKPASITLKTLTKNPIEPHKAPTVVKLHDGCYINAIGLGNPGLEFLKYMNRWGKCQFIVSIGGSSVKEISEVASKVKNFGEIIEVNLSSPNRRGFGESMSAYAKEVTQAVKDVVGNKPVFIKLGPWDSILEIAGKALEGGADGLTLINTLKGMKIDLNSLSPILSYGTGGISGKCIHSLAVRIIHDVYKEYNPEIIGIGGVFSWEDAIELMSVGAKMIGIGTAILELGLAIVPKIREGVEEYLAEKGLRFCDVIGKAVRK